MHIIAFSEICSAFFWIPDSYGRSVRESKIVGISELRFHTRIPRFHTALHAAHSRRQLVCAFLFLQSPNQQFWFSDSRADSAPLARAEGADGVSPRPLRRHAAGETLRGAHGPRRRGKHPRDTSSRSRSNPTALPAKRLSQDTASPATDPRPADDILFPPSRTRISRAWRWTPTTIRCS